MGRERGRERDKGVAHAHSDTGVTAESPQHRQASLSPPAFPAPKQGKGENARKPLRKMGLLPALGCFRRRLLMACELL